MLVSSLRAAARHCIRQLEGGCPQGLPWGGHLPGGVARGCEPDSLLAQDHLAAMEEGISILLAGILPGPTGQMLQDLLEGRSEQKAEYYPQEGRYKLQAGDAKTSKRTHGLMKTEVKMMCEQAVGKVVPKETC